MFLLDTNVVSELRETRTRKPHPRVAAWARSIDPADQYTTSVTILELEIGVVLKRRHDAAQAAIFRTWMDSHVFPAFAGRILEFDSEAAQHCAALHEWATPPFRNALIAGIAMARGFAVVTRNVRDFQPMGVPVFNPWEDFA